jgi:hypothetical protein
MKVITESSVSSGALNQIARIRKMMAVTATTFESQTISFPRNLKLKHFLYKFYPSRAMGTQ